MIRIVPEGHWRLAGGANHRLRTPNATSPGRGDGIGSRDFRRPGWGSDSIFTTNRWFAPPANFHDASGARYQCRPQVSSGSQIREQFSAGVIIFDARAEAALTDGMKTFAAMLFAILIALGVFYLIHQQKEAAADR